MIARTKGMIARKDSLAGIVTPEVMIPARYAFIVRFYDPRTQRFVEESVSCTSGSFARYELRDWVRLRVNTQLWKPLQRWVIDE